jgi:hypothetical protein
MATGWNLIKHACYLQDDDEDMEEEEETEVGDVDAKNAIKLLESINE